MVFSIKFWEKDVVLLISWHFEQGTIRKNRKNLTEKIISQLLTEGLCCRHRSKKIFFFNVENIFFQKDLPQQLSHSSAFDIIQGLSSLQTLLLPVSLHLVTSFSHKHTFNNTPWTSSCSLSFLIFFYNKLLRLSRISASQNKCRFWSFLIILPSHLLHWKYI